MQTTEAPTATTGGICRPSPTILPMVKPYRPGIEARRAILRELRRRLDSDEPPATSRQLAEVAGLSAGQCWQHLRTLMDAGLVARNPKRRAGYILTPAGEIATA